MKKHRGRTHKGANVPGFQGGFQLPPEVSVSKQPLPSGWAFVFRHRLLGELGRIVLEETGDGRTTFPTKWWVTLPTRRLPNGLRSLNLWEWKWRGGWKQ